MLIHPSKMPVRIGPSQTGLDHVSTLSADSVLDLTVDSAELVAQDLLLLSQDFLNLVHELIETILDGTGGTGLVAALGKDLVARAGGDKAAAQPYCQRIQYDEEIGQGSAFNTLLIFSRIFPFLDDGLSFGDSLGYFELYDLAGAQWGQVVPGPDHIANSKQHEQPE